MSRFSAVILAAGKGKRTGLPYPKVLHPLCGKTMLSWVTEAILALHPEQTIVVVSPEYQKQISQTLPSSVLVTTQDKPLGTGDALRQGVKSIQRKQGSLLVACGDTPLLVSELFLELIQYHESKKLAVTILTAQLSNPTGYGRIVRGKGKQRNVKKIVEEKDASSLEKKIKEINTGTYCFDLEKLHESLPHLLNKNAQQEYYLTDSIDWLVKHRKKVSSFLVKNSEHALGVNTLRELSVAHKVLGDRIKEKWLNNGVVMLDPDTIYVDADVTIEPGTFLYPYTFLESGTKVGANCKIGPFTRLVSTQLGESVTVQNSIALNAQIGEQCFIGPFAYLRPGTRLDTGVKVGDFVEIKNSSIGSNSKVPHLSYIGDATIGKEVNVGAGTITCNYDGKTKHPTVIEDGAFIGSNTNLVAPVTVGKEAITGAGSVVLNDVGAGTVVAGVPAKIIREEVHGG